MTIECRGCVLSYCPKSFTKSCLVTILQEKMSISKKKSELIVDILLNQCMESIRTDGLLKVKNLGVFRVKEKRLSK